MLFLHGIEGNLISVWYAHGDVLTGAVLTTLFDFKGGQIGLKG
jgi:hypothetical protein